MKLTICQFGKLFLLLTAFLFVTKFSKTFAVATATDSSFSTIIPPVVHTQSAAAAAFTTIDYIEASDILNLTVNTVAFDAEQDIERKFQIHKQQQQQQNKQQLIASAKSIIINNSNKVKVAQEPVTVNNIFPSILLNKKKNENKNKTITTTSKQNLTQQHIASIGLKTLLNNIAPNKDVYDDTNAAQPLHSLSLPTNRQAKQNLSSPLQTNVTDLKHKPYFSLQIPLLHNRSQHDILLRQQQKSKHQKYIKTFNSNSNNKQQPILRSSSSNLKIPSAKTIKLTATSTTSPSSVSSSSSLSSSSLQYNPAYQATAHNSIQPAFKALQQQTLSKIINSATVSSSIPSSALPQQRVGILMPSRLLNKMNVKQGFHNFVEFFQVNLYNASVDFIPDDGKLQHQIKFIFLFFS